MSHLLKTIIVSSLFVISSLNQVFALDIKTWETSNGVKVYFVESHNIPVVDVRLAFKAGSSRDGNKPGISRLVSALLVEGTGDALAEEIALQFESVGAVLGHDSLRDMGLLSLRSLSDDKTLNSVSDWFAKVAALPSFPQQAIDRDRKSMLISLQSRKKDIGSVVSDAFFDALYPGHPYQLGSHGESSSLKAITQNDLKQFHQKYNVANNANLAIVGDLSIQQAKQYAEALTQYLQPGQAAKLIKPAALTKGSDIKIPFKATQAHVIQGLPVVTRKDADYFALYVGNHILGGSGFSSQLMKEIRDNRGLSYSVYSYFLPMESNGPFQMALQTSKRQVSEATQLMQKILMDFISNGPSQKELEHAQKNITGGFPLKVDSNKKIIGYLSLIGFYQLPLDYLDNFNEKVMAVTVDSIRDAFKRRVIPEKMIRITVGETAQ